MRVLLLAGGDSSERDVSLVSGEAVYTALKALGHGVQAIDPATGKTLLGRGGEFRKTALRTASTSDVAGIGLLGLFSSPILDKIDVVFNALHGGDGENGSIQNLLDLAGLKYTGSGMTASAIAMDKAISKRLCESAGIHTPAWALFRIGDGNENLGPFIDEIKDRFGFPIIVKPNDGGSTIGLSKVDRAEDLVSAIIGSLVESPDVLVEEYIAGRELTVATLDGVAYPVVEIEPSTGLYDYESKYTEGGSKYVVPAEIPEKTARDLQAAALRAYDVIGASGLARVDFLLNEEGEYRFLELNTVPGMTNLSLAPMAARAAGIEFPQLIEKQLESGLSKPGA